MRFAAIGDLHVRANDPGPVLDQLPRIASEVEAILVAGDITEHGWVGEAMRAAEVFHSLPVPIFAVLGNHDLRAIRRAAFRQVLVGSGLILLDGASQVVSSLAVPRVGLAGISGCGGGFWQPGVPDALPAKAWNTIAVRQRREAAKLDLALASLDTEIRVVLMHFAPTPTTLGLEPGMKYWMLGNGELGRVIDRHQVDLVIHGHAHLGNRAGHTMGGIPVHNVAYPVRRTISVFGVENGRIVETSASPRVLVGARH